VRVIVVGATGTIGKEVVKALAARGHDVVGASRTGKVKVDLQDTDSIDRLFIDNGPFDAAISCAGNAAFKPLTELTVADFEVGLRSKLMGQVNLARIGARHVREGGSITLTSGVLATRPMTGGSAVSLVNAAIDAFVRAADFESPRGVRFNSVSPGWITETLVTLGMDPAPGLSAAHCAKFYVAIVEGSQRGQVVEAAKA
jgi:NAD(P)-dependent dehydrogenase (short-subunit alcohol dehydrogenase family)